MDNENQIILESKPMKIKDENKIKLKDSKKLYFFISIMTLIYIGIIPFIFIKLKEIDDKVQNNQNKNDSLLLKK